MKYAFHPEALAELKDAALDYASKQPGLELRFMASVEMALQRILERPTACAVLERDIRRCLTRIFPYAILHAMEGDSILILAVMHCHRRPGYWKQRREP